MMKHSLVLRLGFFLLVLGVILNRVIPELPAWTVGIIHLSAIACFAIYLIEYRKNKK